MKRTLKTLYTGFKFLAMFNISLIKSASLSDIGQDVIALNIAELNIDLVLKEIMKKIGMCNEKAQLNCYKDVYELCLEVIKKYDAQGHSIKEKECEKIEEEAKEKERKKIEEEARIKKEAEEGAKEVGTSGEIDQSQNPFNQTYAGNFSNETTITDPNILYKEQYAHICDLIYKDLVNTEFYKFLLEINRQNFEICSNSSLEKDIEEVLGIMREINNIYTPNKVISEQPRGNRDDETEEYEYNYDELSDEKKQILAESYTNLLNKTESILNKYNDEFSYKIDDKVIKFFLDELKSLFYSDIEKKKGSGFDENLKTKEFKKCIECYPEMIWNKNSDMINFKDLVLRDKIKYCKEEGEEFSKNPNSWRINPVNRLEGIKKNKTVY